MQCEAKPQYGNRLQVSSAVKPGWLIKRLFALITDTWLVDTLQRRSHVRVRAKCQVRRRTISRYIHCR